MANFADKFNRVLNHCKQEFGEEVKFLPDSGGSFTVRGIFDHNYVATDPDTEEIVSANQPALGVNLNDFSVSINEGDKFEIRNLTYRVIDNREDGQGGATVLLHRINDDKKIIKRTLT